MNILLTNDDGVYADGIRNLAEVLVNKGHQVTIVAPDRERSAAGHSITILDPLRVDEVNLGISGLASFKVSGTPADSVKLGAEKLVKSRPDFIISGINDGPNLGYDVLYSGTVSAAIEGWMMGYNSLAVSLARREDRNYRYTATFIEGFLNKIKDIFTEKPLLLNINVPDLPEEDIKGVTVTKLGTSLYEDTFEERVDPMGKKYYWLTGGGGRKEKEIDTDIWAIKNNYISITPLKLELTDSKMLKFLKNKI
jgi:5'-nucleotidase